MNIFCAKLSWDTRSEDLEEAFLAYGPVTSANVIMERDSGRSKGFGFVEMENEEDGLAAIEALDGSELDGRTIVVKKAEPRKEKKW